MPNPLLATIAVRTDLALAQAGSAALGDGAGGFGWLLLKTAVILIAVCALAYLVIRVLFQRLLGPGASRRGATRLRVLDRLVVEPRRSVQVLLAGERVLLIGVTEQRISLLCELDAEQWTAIEAEQPVAGAFEKAIRRALERETTGSESETEEATGS